MTTALAEITVTTGIPSWWVGTELISVAYVIEGFEVGRLDLHEDGYIEQIYVNEEYRRQGIATALYRYALESDNVPSPIHSPVLSHDGALWAKAVGGKHWKDN